MQPSSKEKFLTLPNPVLNTARLIPQRQSAIPLQSCGWWQEIPR